MTARSLSHPYRQALMALLVTVAVSSASAQTPVAPDKNKYTPAQDVQIGREAAAEVRRELPMLNDERVDEYVERVGERLVQAIPQNLRHNEFRYSFEVVNQKEINAFALPGGPMFLHRGMIEAAKSEGEVAGVMAHEIAHVALRHGTAQATKAEKFQIGAIAGQVLGAIVGGAAGSIIAQGSNFGLGAYFLKYGREYEREADVLGAQIMARAGYDPRRMADMFRTIEQQSRSGGGGPEWLSSHPNPCNRYEAIQREAANLRIEGTAPSQAEFQTVRSRLRGMSPAYTAEQIARAKQQGRRLPGTSGGNDAPRRVSNTRVEPPSSDFERVTVGSFLRLEIPSNWRGSDGSNSVTFAPEGAHYETGNGSGFTHGLQIGVVPNDSANLQQATDELLRSLQQSNPDIRRQNSGYVRERIGGRQALSTTLRNVSATGAPEMVGVSTVQLRDGSILYLIQVAPQAEASVYSNAFRRMKQTVEIDDRQLPSR